MLNFPTDAPAKRLALRGFPLSGWIFLGVFLLRLIALVRLTDSQFLLPHAGDMQFYNNWALRILRGEWTTHTAFYGLPLYAYLLAAIYKIGGYSPFLPGLLQATLEAGTAVLLFKLGASVFTTSAADETPKKLPVWGQMIGLTAALGWAFFQPAAAYAIILMPTAWLVFIFWFLVWQIVRRSQAPRCLGLLSLGLLIGFTSMGIATVLFLVPLLAGALFIRWPGTLGSRVRGVALILAGLLLGASPAAIHNYCVARDPVFLSAHSGVNFWIGNNPIANGYPKFPPGLHAGQEAMLQDSITTAERTVGRPLRRSEVSAFWSAKANQWIHQHPAAFFRLLGVKIKNFWNAYQYDDISVVTALRDQKVILPGLGFGLIAALALPGLLIACWKYPKSRWIAAAVFLHMASLLTVFVTERYRLAAVPGLLLFAAFGVWELGRTLATGRLREAALLVALLFGATGFVSLPQKDSSLWALDIYNSGLQALEVNNLPLARQKLDRAYAYSPLNAEINFAEGNLHFALGETAVAKKFYLATLNLDRGHAGACNNLGVIASQEENWPLAIAYFHRALRSSPNEAKLHYLLARAELSAGDFLLARQEISEAIKLDPRPEAFTALRAEIATATPPLP
jgi:tetratricopeptide (TPR) repeat protein